MIKPDDDKAPEGEWWWLDEIEENTSAAENPRPWKTESLEKFRLLKNWIRECDPVDKWPVEARIERVRKRVMDVIEDGAWKDREGRAEETQWLERRKAKSFKV